MSSQKPRHQRATIRYLFDDEYDASIALVEQTMDLIRQFARMAECDDPTLRQKGMGMLRMVAECCIAGQFALADQKRKSKKDRTTIETDDGGTSSTAIIKELAKRCDALGDYLKPADLRPMYVARLDDLGLSPTEDKLGVSFDGGRTTWGSFRAMLSRERRKKEKSET